MPVEQLVRSLCDTKQVSRWHLLCYILCYVNSHGKVPVTATGVTSRQSAVGVPCWESPVNAGQLPPPCGSTVMLAAVPQRLFCEAPFFDLASL